LAGCGAAPPHAPEAFLRLAVARQDQAGRIKAERLQLTDGCFGRDDFIYDHQTVSYSCPAGEELRSFWQPGREAKEGAC
jgi:hypothetical protein